ncbi:hypothetical protein ACH3XW_17530 [Acanthocheilonema viteae]
MDDNATVQCWILARTGGHGQGKFTENFKWYVLYEEKNISKQTETNNEYVVKMGLLCGKCPSATEYMKV